MIHRYSALIVPVVLVNKSLWNISEAFSPNHPLNIHHLSTTRNIRDILINKQPTGIQNNPTNLFSSESSSGEGIAGAPPKLSEEEEEELQWNLFLKHHARGKWRGTWTSYDFMGDVIDNTMASVNLIHDETTDTVTHTHDIVVGSTQSDCETCFDSDDVRTLPVGKYSKGNLARYRCASSGMSCGPSLTRAGSMSTELVLTDDDNRLRVVYQHAPVWEKGIEPGSCPPQGLKLFRVMVAKESLSTDVPVKENASFAKKVPPFMWHKKWAGTAWTWGEQTGDRGWSVTDLEETDAWHGRPTGDTPDTWSLRLNAGGILLQCPRVITSGFAGICRVAWLPDKSEEKGGNGVDNKLLRMESSVLALEPIIDEEQDAMLGFFPPTLGSLRYDKFSKMGELENASMLEKLRNSGELDDIDASIAPSPEPTTPTKQETSVKPQQDHKKNFVSKEEDSSKDSGLDDIRNALKL